MNLEKVIGTLVEKLDAVELKHSWKNNQLCFY